MSTQEPRSADKPPTLSLYLLAQAERRLGYPKRVAYDPKIAQAVSRLAEGIRNANLGPFAENEEAKWLAPEGKILDEFLCRVLLRQVPTVVGRAVASAPFRTKRKPPADVSVSAREATRCFVFGFWDASIALSRSALEAALKAELRRFAPPPEKLSEVIELARTRRLLDAPSQFSAKVIKGLGDKVLHNAHHGDEKAAADTINALRAVLRHVYGVTSEAARGRGNA
jgi:hypothetical protein